MTTHTPAQGTNTVSRAAGAGAGAGQYAGSGGRTKAGSILSKTPNPPSGQSGDRIYRPLPFLYNYP